MRNPLDKYTTGPLLDVQNASPTSVFEHIDYDCISEWEDIKGLKLLAIPFDPTQLTADGQGLTAGKVLTAVAEITNAEECDVCEPRQSEEAKRANRMPNVFLVHGLQNNQAEILLERKIWSSLAITFRVSRFAPTCPNFLFTIKGWKTITLKSVYPVVKLVWDSEKACSFISGLIDAVPPAQRENVKKEIKALLESMTIVRLDTKEVGNTLTPRFNVYADSSMISIDEVWSRLRAHYAARAYFSTTLGKGTVEQNPFNCTLCHGVDHPRGLCPFPDTPDWNGPKRDTNVDRRNARNRGSESWGQRGQTRF